MSSLVGGIVLALGPAHLVALIGPALLAGPAGFWQRAAVVAAFAVGLAAGLGALAAGIGETAAGDALMLAAALCGLAAAMALPVPPAITAALALVVGLAGGLDSPPDAITLREAVLSLIGTACGGIAAFALLVAAAGRLARTWQGIVLRVAGSWIAAIAILVLALHWVA
jgi:urease accessory protein